MSKKLILPEHANAANRLSVVLRTKGVREEVAALIGRNEFSAVPEFRGSSGAIVDQLGRAPDLQSDASFWDSRRMSEAIILAKARPVMFIQDGVIDTAPLPKLEALLKPHRKALAKPIASIGRIELSDHDELDWCGTGWRIEEDLIVTNRHVALIFAQRQGGTFKFRRNQMDRTVRARIDFREEFRSDTSEEFGIAEILWIAEDVSNAPDMAILKIKKDPGLPPPLQIADKNAAVGAHIAVVGYPARDSRNDASTMSNLFNDVYDVKRFSPGEVVTAGSDEVWYLTHDASTLGGNSGSAVLDIESRRVVGLHFGGSFRKTNYAVKASVIKGLIGRRSWVPVSKESLAIPVEAFSEKKRTVAMMKGRPGYDGKFLGVQVAMPKPGATHQVLKTDFDHDALPYMHFSIVMSESRRLPIFTAENIDGAKKINLKRKDAWGYDPRIAKDAQVGHKEFYGPEPFDKGHMVRRENPGWGDTEEEAQQGEDDSFVYTNAIPQMPQLNQKTWLSLEDYVLKSAKTHGLSICVMTGPVFRADDPSYSDVQVPTDFWKIVAALDAETQELLVSAYLLSQEGFMPEEGFRYGPFKTYQVPLKRIEALADLKFAKAVREADVFSDYTHEEMIRTGRYIEVTSERDIVLARRK